MKSQDAHMKQESHQIANAVNLYKNDNNGRVPVGNTHSSNNRNDIVYENNTNDTRAAYMSSMQELVDGGYLPSIPESPTGESYSYYVTEDEDQAVFAVELNFEESGSSNKNSCDAIEVTSYYENCTSIYEYFNFESCSNRDPNDYNPETQTCFELGPDEIENYCSSGLIASQEVPDIVCSIMVLTPEYYGVCDNVELPICSGNSNSDYCSCI
jgi:hypothetical protein